MMRTFLAVALFAVSAIAADVPLINLIPVDAKVIGGLNVARTLSSPFGQFLLKQMREDDPGFRQLVEETGFDPRQHLRDVVFASTTTGKSTGLVVARGVFNGPQILAAAQKKGGTLTTYQGFQLLMDPKGKVGVAIAEGSLVIAGEERLVKAAIDQRAATAAITPLARKAADFDSRYDAWFVANGMVLPQPSTRPDSPMAAPAAALSAIQESSGGVEFGSVVRITGEAVTRSDKDAQALVDVVRFVMSMAQLNQKPETQQFESLMNSVNVRAEANTVRFSAAVPAADLEQLMKPKRAARQAAAR